MSTRRLRASTDNIVDLYFPPVRDEAPASGSTTPTMLLQVSIPNDNNVYATPFMGAAWNLSAMTEPLNSQAAPAPPTTEAELRSDLMSESPEYDTIDLPANTTIMITQPLEITHSVQIIGNNATLLFEQGDTAAWPATASGAIYVETPFYNNIQLDLNDFTIKFDMSSPIRWSNPAGNDTGSLRPREQSRGFSTRSSIPEIPIPTRISRFFRSIISRSTVRRHSTVPRLRASRASSSKAAIP